MLGCLLAFYAPCFGHEEEWIKQVATRTDPEDIEWLKTHLKESFSAQAIEGGKGYQIDKCQQCFHEEVASSNSQVLVFMSFSIPTNVWMNLSQELEHVQGTFVLRGIPQQSFQLLAKRVLELKNQGVNAPIQIDPQSFKTYQIEHVPSFVVVDDEKFDKVIGNVSLKFALNLMTQKGQTSLAPLLYSIFREGA
jgi:conjugal transfer pilus assembly protein TrbC